MRLWSRKNKLIRKTIDPDEVFLDAYNSPQFDTQQFEGRIEKPISKQSVRIIGLVFLLIAIVFSFQLGKLQIAKGETYFDISENNTLFRSLVFADRGVVYDREGKELAWNEVRKEGEAFSARSYIQDPGFGVLLGYVQYPKTDKQGFYWQTEFVGVQGLESQYNDILNGENGYKIVERNALGDSVSENIVNLPIDGENINLTVHAGMQTAMYNAMADLSERIGYQGGAGLLMDIETGELLVATSYPEYDPQKFADAEDSAYISQTLNDARTPFLNRFVSGLYSPGSTVKPFIALGALHEGLITGNTQVLSTGKITIPNPYNPELFSTFRDWQEDGVGMTNVVKAIAESVNTFFYAIGGGYKNQDGLGVTKIEKYIRLFGIGSSTQSGIAGEVDGVVPNPTWKARVFPDDTVWRLGDTYNTSIGQYGFQVTPMQMINAVAKLVSDGYSPSPTLMPRLTQKDLTRSSDWIDFDERDIDLVKRGMRQVVTDGTGRLLNVSYIDVAAKTGTAQTGRNNEFVNSWSMGFFPYQNPKYAFAVLMEKGPSENDLSASFAMRQFLDWVHLNAPEYLE
jgi:penicillin-binding protein 2